jgi:hypothetical protein
VISFKINTMSKEKEVVSGLLAYISSLGKKDFIQEVTEHQKVARLGDASTWEDRSYRRVSDRAELKRLSFTQFEVVATGEKIIIS